MHIQQRNYIIAVLAEESDALQMRFLGFQLPVNVQQAFRREHPASDASGSLDAWAQCERRHPATFQGMYQLFVEKR